MDTNMTNSTAEALSVTNPMDDIVRLLNEDEEQTVDEPEEQEPEAGEEADAEDSTEEGESEESGEEQEDITWSKALGVDDSQLALDEEGNLKGINVKIDGEVSTVPVKDLIAGYQLNKHVTQKSQALAEEKRQFETIKTEASTKLYEKLATADKLLSFMENSLTSEFQSIDWNQLRANNPGEYAAAVTDFQARKAQLDKIKSGISEEHNLMTAEQQAEQQQRYQAYLNDQFQQVLANNPDWSNPDKMRTDVSALGDFVAATYNIPPEIFASVNDARYIEVLKDAMAYRKGKVIAEKKVQNVPKFQKSASKTSKPMSKVTQLTLSARKAKGPAQRMLQRDAVAELIMGNI